MLNGLRLQAHSATDYPSKFLLRESFTFVASEHCTGCLAFRQTFLKQTAQEATFPIKKKASSHACISPPKVINLEILLLKEIKAIAQNN